MPGWLSDRFPATPAALTDLILKPALEDEAGHPERDGRPRGHRSGQRTERQPALQASNTVAAIPRATASHPSQYPAMAMITPARIRPSMANGISRAPRTG